MVAQARLRGRHSSHTGPYLRLCVAICCQPIDLRPAPLHLSHDSLHVSDREVTIVWKSSSDAASVTSRGSRASLVQDCSQDNRTPGVMYEHPELSTYRETRAVSSAAKRSQMWYQQRDPLSRESAVVEGGGGVHGRRCASRWMGIMHARSSRCVRVEACRRTKGTTLTDGSKTSLRIESVQR